MARSHSRSRWYYFYFHRYLSMLVSQLLCFFTAVPAYSSSVFVRNVPVRNKGVLAAEDVSLFLFYQNISAGGHSLVDYVNGNRGGVIMIGKY
jgi:hypothetical protein